MRALVVGFLLVAPAWAGADVVELTSGERVEGRDVRASPDLVTIQAGGRTLVFERDRVRAIHLGPPPAPCR